MGFETFFDSYINYIGKLEMIKWNPFNIDCCSENTSRRRVFSVKLDYACDVISMFKINYTIDFHGISVL